MAAVLSLCDRTGVMVEPWADAGYECWCVDLQHEPGETRHGNIIQVGADIHNWIPPRIEFVAAFAFPSCTDLAASGARWFRGKGLRSLGNGILLVARCAELLEWTGARWMLENPIGTLSTYWRKPDASFDPCDYGGYLAPPR